MLHSRWVRYNGRTACLATQCSEYGVSLWSGMLMVVRHMLVLAVCTGSTFDCVCSCTDFIHFDDEVYKA